MVYLRGKNYLCLYYLVTEGFAEILDGYHVSGLQKLNLAEHRRFGKSTVRRQHTIGILAADGIGGPDTLVGQCVSVRIYSEKLVIFYQGEKVAVHERFYTGGQWSVRLEHYLNTLICKPGALNGSVALKQVPQVHTKDLQPSF